MGIVDNKCPSCGELNDDPHLYKCPECGKEAYDCCIAGNNVKCFECEECEEEE